MKVWVYIDASFAPKRFKGWRQFDRDDRRLDFAYPYAPEGMAKFEWGKSTKQTMRWCYVNFGDTQQEVADKYNHFNLEKIKKLEAEAAHIRARLLKPETKS